MKIKENLFLLFVLFSYTPLLAQGVYEAWVARYPGVAPSAIAVDDSGNVYVTGNSSAGSGIPTDYATIKYSSLGDTLWIRRYNGPGNYVDEAHALAVDVSGNVYVTGWSDGSGTYYDYATIKYSSAGDTLWVKRYNGPGNSGDNANALAIDDSGNVYVSGTSYDGTSYDFTTIKYSPAGDTLWVKRYNGPGNDADGASDLVVDDSGNVYVTGASSDVSLYLDYATVKYSPCSAKPGDANKDNQILLSDIITIVNFLFKSQPAPNPLCRGGC